LVFNRGSNVLLDESKPCIEESFEEILSIDEVDLNHNHIVETEPLCASCFNPLDVDDKQDIAYCDRCQTTVFVERRNIT